MSGSGEQSAKPEANPIVKLAIEAGPLLVFFTANAFKGIYVATAAFVAATVVSLAAAYILERRIAIMPLVSGLFVLLFGGLTIWFNDEIFIKLKPTLVSGLFGIVLLGGYVLDKRPLRAVLGQMLEITDEGWRMLTLRWGLFFLFLAVLNEVVWRTVSTDTWVSFKVFGLLPITMAFAIWQSVAMQKHMLDEDGDGAD